MYSDQKNELLNHHIIVPSAARGEVKKAGKGMRRETLQADCLTMDQILDSGSHI